MEMECEAYPDAQCVNEYCGGCVAKHYIGDREVHCGYGKLYNNTCIYGTSIII